jgi:hypothetical protein
MENFDHPETFVNGEDNPVDMGFVAVEKLPKFTTCGLRFWGNRATIGE